MKHLVLLIATAFLLLLSNQLAAQTTNNVLYLKNGSIIRGTILEANPDGNVKIQTADGSIFVYSMAEVEKITNEASTANSNTNNQQPLVSSFEMKKRGYVGSVELGALKYSDDGALLFSGHVLNGYLIIPNLSISIGAGVEKGKNIVMVPLYMDVRTYLLRTKNTPFLSFAGGFSMYGEDFSLFNSMGAMAQVIAGGQFMFKRNLGINLSVGYRMQRLAAYSFIPSFTLHGFTGKMGFVF